MCKKKVLSILMVIVILLQALCFNAISANAVDDNKIDALVSIAKSEVGYQEITYPDGTFYSKYGDWYGYPNGAWCAMFISWCANQAGISTNIIPKFASCSVGRDWFINKNMWKTKEVYTPTKGDIIFFNNCTHVGIVEKYDDGIVYTIEGNACDDNKENYAVRQRVYSVSSSKITGYGIPDLSALKIFNGKANSKATAYMMPDSSSQTVWEIWQNDDLEVLCSDGDFYLVMYPFLSTGKFVCAYVNKDAVETYSTIPSSSDFYSLNRKGILLENVNLYHNPSNSELLSNTGEDKKIRAKLSKDNEVNVLFEKDNYYFIEYSGITGFVESQFVNLTSDDFISTYICLGDVDQNNAINIMDATLIQKFISELVSFNDIQKINADVNDDKSIDITDATSIQKYIVQLISDFSGNQKETIPPATGVINIESINLANNYNVYLDESKKLEYSVSPENATDRNILWLVVDENIATVSSDGIITGHNIGSTKVIAFTANGVRTECTVTVLKRNIDAESISIDNTNPNILNNGETLKLNATVLPTNTTVKTVMWSSSNPDVASVDDNGLVTAKTAGTVTITANCINSSVNATATIRVNQTTSYIENGTYCLKLKDTNSYLDHQGQGANGTNVLLWSGDGSSNANQKIKLERIDDNRYMLWSAVNTDVLIDVNRGSSYSDPIAIGKNIDLWKNNDWEAQEWLFTKTYDGYYIIRLNTMKEGAIEASGKNNGDNIFFGTYNPNNDMQKWELLTTGEYQEKETTAWVCNTEDIGNVHVRSGPGSNYASIGGFNEGQQVTVLGDISSTWLRVRGTNRHDGSTIIGYSHRDYYRFDQVVVTERTAWIYNTAPIGNVNVRSGAGTNYASIGGFNEGQQITVIGDLVGDFYKVRGANRHDGSIIEGYTHKDYITFTKPELDDTDNPAPDLYSNSYNKTYNPFAQSNLYGQCTWYAWGRTHELTNKSLPCRGNAQTWYSVAKNNGYTVSSTPRKNSIAVWSYGSYGHVAFVEKVSGNNVTITESNWDRVTYDNQYDINSGIYYYSGYKTLTVSQMNSRYGTLLGYIYV